MSRLRGAADPRGAGHGDGVPGPDFYARDVIAVAHDLLGALVTTYGPDGVVTVRVSEVEAYRGATDPGSHAFRGRTARNAVMFDEPGRLYVYRHLGLHHCVNVVAGPAGTPAAVLLRAGEVVEGSDLARERRTAAGALRADLDLARGPARLAVALGMDLTWNGEGVTDVEGRVVIRRPVDAVATAVESGPRVGVSGDGGDGTRFPWRLWLAGDPTVSIYRPAPARRRGTDQVPAHGTMSPRHVLKETQ